MTVAAESAGQPKASPTSAKPWSRQSLVAPVIVIISISVLTAGGLIWMTAQVLDQNAKAATQHLAKSMLSVKAAALRNLAMDYAWWNDASRPLDHRFRETWANEAFVGRLSDAYDLSATLVIGADDRPVAAFANGRPLGAAARMPVPAALEALVRRARAARSSGARAEAGLVKLGDQIHMVALSPLTMRAADTDQASSEPPPVLVLTQALDGNWLISSGSAFGLHGLTIFADLPPDSHFAVELRDADREVLGHLAWRHPRPGDVLVWWLLPSFACGLMTITYLLYQFFRNTDLVVEREDYLVSAIERERELRDLKSRFVTMVSHELRTPLSTIRSAADLLDRYDDRFGPEERRRELVAIRGAVDGVTRMMEEVLALGRSDATVEPHNTRLTLGVFCQELWNETAQALGASHRLSLCGSAIKKDVVTDETLLRAVLSNLIHNAIKYSPESEEVRIEITSEADDCAIKVTDNGRGISPEDHDKIFDAFHRGKNSGMTSGTGLGLAVAKAAAERLGGRIDVKSDPGSATTFELVLPGLLRARSSSRHKEES